MAPRDLRLLVATVLSGAVGLAPSAQAPLWELRTAQALIHGIRARTSNVRPLDLLADLHDEPTGLCSEGVWHNAWLGTAYVQAAGRIRALDAAGTTTAGDGGTLFAHAVQLADSLYDLSYDEGFRRRTSSGAWQSAEGDSAATAFDASGERASFYLPSRERRSAQNGAAVIFYSMLADEVLMLLLLVSRCRCCGVAVIVRRAPATRRQAAMRGSGEASRLTVRVDEIGANFLGEFYSGAERRFRRASEGAPAPERVYSRAVDQAIGSLACLRLARLVPRRHIHCRAHAHPRTSSTLQRALTQLLAAGSVTLTRPSLSPPPATAWRRFSTISVTKRTRGETANLPITSGLIQARSIDNTSAASRAYLGVISAASRAYLGGVSDGPCACRISPSQLMARRDRMLRDRRNHRGR